jgi:hypothetical protein
MFSCALTDRIGGSAARAMWTMASWPLQCVSISRL